MSECDHCDRDIISEIDDTHGVTLCAACYQELRNSKPQRQKPTPRQSEYFWIMPDAECGEAREPPLNLGGPNGVGSITAELAYWAAEAVGMLAAKIGSCEPDTEWGDDQPQCVLCEASRFCGALTRMPLAWYPPRKTEG